MAVTIKNLARGTLTLITAVTPGPIAGKAWIIKNVVLTNKDTVARTVDVKLMYGATPAYLAPPGLAVGAKNTVVLNDEITIQNPTGGTAEAVSIALLVASTGIDYVLNGVERDIV
jgi:hypothetical protein